MEAITTIHDMLIGKKIYVPNYQRAYSWDTDLSKIKSNKQVNTFLTDLEDYIISLSRKQNRDKITPYYFGHFIYEKNQINLL